MEGNLVGKPSGEDLGFKSEPRAKWHALGVPFNAAPFILTEPHIQDTQNLKLLAVGAQQASALSAIPESNAHRVIHTSDRGISWGVSHGGISSIPSQHALMTERKRRVVGLHRGRRTSRPCQMGWTMTAMEGQTVDIIVGGRSSCWHRPERNAGVTDGDRGLGGKHKYKKQQRRTCSTDLRPDFSSAHSPALPFISPWTFLFSTPGTAGPCPAASLTSPWENHSLTGQWCGPSPGHFHGYARPSCAGSTGLRTVSLR